MLDEAKQAGAVAVVLDINTFGGRVDAAVQIRDSLLNSKVRTIAFINKRAISAGALSALASEKIVMAEGDVVIPGLIEKGRLLTLTTEEALQHEVVDLRANTLESALQELWIVAPEIRKAWPNRAENMVRFPTHPVVSGLLITIAMLGLILEVLVIPGFGVARLLGIAAIVTALLSLVGPGFTTGFMLAAAGRFVWSMVAAIVISLILRRLLPKLPFGRRLILRRGLAAAEGWASAPESDTRWVGKTGRASSPLRPAGIADIDGTRVDVVSDSEHIDAGETIRATRVDGNRVVVRHISDTYNQE